MGKLIFVKIVIDSTNLSVDYEVVRFAGVTLGTKRLGKEQ